jgi:hypothetical protein
MEDSRDCDLAVPACQHYLLVKIIQILLASSGTPSNTSIMIVKAQSASGGLVSVSLGPRDDRHDWILTPAEADKLRASLEQILQDDDLTKNTDED